MSVSNAKIIVEQYLQAFGSKDTDTAHALLDKSKFTFRGPIDTFDNVQDYLESTKQLGAIIRAR